MLGKRIKIAIIATIILAAVILLIVFFPDILALLGKIIHLFLPFVLGYLFSLLVNPLANLLEKRFKLPRNLAAILVILLCVGVVGGILASVILKIVEEIRGIYQNLPAIQINIVSAWEEISHKFSNIYDAVPPAVQEMLDELGKNFTASISGIAGMEYTPIFRSAGNIAKSVPGIFVGAIAFLLSSFFMISDSKTVKNALERTLPDRIQIKFERMKTEVKRYIGGYVKAQLIIMFFAFIILFIGLNILNIDYSLLIALGTAFLDALPFFGSGAVLWTWAAVSFLTSEFGRGIGLIIIYLCVIFTRQMIEPKIVSQKIGMNPILTLMAMYVGYRLFSIGGMIVGPLLLMLFISLKRAGFFDGIIEASKNINMFIKNEYNKIKEQIKE
ncbi:MAG: sporulation integral membrane protein YtvI [Eubacteriales bacterium]|nr:sporulation integral membrane protein YtvI [Eubacteriales bacterium]